MDTNILDTIDMRELGKELQQARIKRGLTQEEAAKLSRLLARRSRRSRKASGVLKLTS